MDFRRLHTSRREFLWVAGVSGTGIVAACRGAESTESAKGKEPTKDRQEEEVSPAEDLMREHGVLDRILLIYEDVLGRFEPARDVDPGALRDAAKIVRDFIENYHEKLEEDHLFPRFEKSGKLVDVVRVLRDQHQAGRVLTDQIEQQSTVLSSKNGNDRKKLETPIKAFIRMYRPHVAREDTVLFPAFRGLVSPSEYDALGEQFEDQEHKLFGDDGFEKIVQQVSESSGDSESKIWPSSHQRRDSR